MRVLITGVSGFVGPHLARLLLERGGRVAGTHLGPVPELDGVELFEADVLDGARVEEVVRRVDPDTIVHLAGLSHVGASWQRMPEYFRVNVLGTENVLAAARGRRILLASSAEVYGLVPPAEQPIDENRPLDPRTPYALTKASAERLAIAAGGSVVRCFNLVGPGQAPHFALPSFARQLARLRVAEGERILRVGNLSAERDFVHVADGAEALRILAGSAEPGEVYNLASGSSFSIAEALDRLMAIAEVAARLEKDPSLFRPVDMPLLRGDASRLRALGWEPHRGLDEALRELWSEAQREEAA